MAIKRFADRGTEDIYDGVDSKAARATCPKSVWPVAVRKLDALDAAPTLASLATPGNNLEKLKGNLAGLHSIRINGQFRVVFAWDNGADKVRIADYH